MKTIVKMISFNDGREREFLNGNWLHVTTYPRMEAVIAAFLGNGYQLHSCSQHLTPALQRKGDWTFFKGGFDLLFTKEVEDNAPDDSDKILSSALTDVLDKTEEEEA